MRDAFKYVAQVEQHFQIDFMVKLVNKVKIVGTIFILGG